MFLVIQIVSKLYIIIKQFFTFQSSSKCYSSPALMDLVVF